MWKFASILLTVICSTAVGYIAYGVQVGGISVAVPKQPVDITYADMVSISLTVFGVIIAVASIALAIAGVIGWNSIEAKAMAVAEQAMKSNLDDADGSLHRVLKQAISDVGSPLHETLRVEIQRTIYAGVQGVEADHDEYSDVADQQRGDKNAE